MKAFAIKHIPTGGYLPKRERKGHTHEEPMVGCIPRLFASRKGANLALKAWLQGDWFQSNTQDSYTGEWDVDQGVKPRADRKPEEMEIVPMRITETRRV